MEQNSDTLPNKWFYSLAGLFCVVYFVVSYLFGPGTGSFLGELNRTNNGLVANFLAAPWRLEFSNILYFALFLFIVYQNKYLFNPAIFLIGAVIFFTDAWVRYDFYHVNTYKMLVLWLFMLLMALEKELFRFKKPLRTHALLVWLLLFLGAISAMPGAILHNFGPNYNFVYEAAALFPLSVISMYVYAMTEDNENIRNIIEWFAVMMVISAIGAFYERFSGAPQNGDDRVKSTFGNTTYFSTYICTLLPLFFFYMLKLDYHEAKAGIHKWKVRIDMDNWLAIFAFALGLMTLYFTESRASYLGFVGSSFVGIGIFMFSFYRKSFVKYFLTTFLGFIVLGAGTLGALFVLGGSGVGRLFSVFHPEGYYPRFIGWMPALKAFLSNPWVGYGLGSYYSDFFNFMWKSGMLFHYEMSYNHTHNEVFETLAEGGLLGFIGVFGVAALLLYYLLKVVQKTEVPTQYRLLSIGVICAIISCYLDSLFSISLRQIAGRLPLFITLGIGFSLVQSHLGIFDLWLAKAKWLWRAFNLKWVRVLTLVVVGVWIGYFFTLWSWTQYGFIQAMQLPEESRLDQMKQILDTHKDIYVLDDLTSALFEKGQFDQVVKYGQMATTVIPYFRVVEAKVGLAYLNMNDFANAKKHLDLERSKNPYIPNVNSPYFYTALRQNDRQDFLNALRDGIVYILVKKNDSMFGLNFQIKGIGDWFIQPYSVGKFEVVEVDNLKTYYDIEISKNFDIKVLVRKDFYDAFHQEVLAEAGSGVQRNQFYQTAVQAVEDFRNSNFTATLANPQNFPKFTMEDRNNLMFNLSSWLVRIGRS